MWRRCWIRWMIEVTTTMVATRMAVLTRKSTFRLGHGPKPRFVQIVPTVPSYHLRNVTAARPCLSIWKVNKKIDLEIWRTLNRRVANGCDQRCKEMWSAQRIVVRRRTKSQDRSIRSIFFTIPPLHSRSWNWIFQSVPRIGGYQLDSRGNKT